MPGDVRKRAPIPLFSVLTIKLSPSDYQGQNQQIELSPLKNSIGTEFEQLQEIDIELERNSEIGCELNQEATDPVRDRATSDKISSDDGVTGRGVIVGEQELLIIRRIEPPKLRPDNFPRILARNPALRLLWFHAVRGNPRTFYTPARPSLAPAGGLSNCSLVRCLTTGAIVRQERIASRYVRDLLPLAFLSPRIVEAIVKGGQPPELTVICFEQGTLIGTNILDAFVALAALNRKRSER